VDNLMHATTEPQLKEKVDSFVKQGVEQKREAWAAGQTTLDDYLPLDEPTVHTSISSKDSDDTDTSSDDTDDTDTSSDDTDTSNTRSTDPDDSHTSTARNELQEQQQLLDDDTDTATSIASNETGLTGISSAGMISASSHLLASLCAMSTEEATQTLFLEHISPNGMNTATGIGRVWQRIFACWHGRQCDQA
jgi:hypothetical protein